MQWSTLASRQPSLEARVREQIVDPGVTLIGTIRRDGTPRISPVEPMLMDGDLWLSMLHGSAKAKDLKRDPRILIHNIVTNRDGEAGEVKIRGTAIEEDDRGLQARYAATATDALGWTPVVGHFHLFRVDIEDFTSIRYENGDQYVTSWPPGREHVRRMETPTSLHAPEPVRQLLVEE